MSEEEYPLTLAHVKQFLATKQDDDSIGICSHPMRCLLTETLNWLYPEKAPWRSDISTYDALIPQPLNFSSKICRLRIAFDTARARHVPVTKSEWRQYLQDNWTEEDGSPFAVADLFED